MMNYHQHGVRSDNSMKIWGPERIVELRRERGATFGFSIVAGKIDSGWKMAGTLDDPSGIFIRSIMGSCSTIQVGNLQVGDRILKIDGINFENVTYDHAMEVMKKTGDSIRLIVQSFMLSNTTPDAIGTSEGIGECIEIQDSTDNTSDDRRHPHENANGSIFPARKNSSYEVSMIRHPTEIANSNDEKIENSYDSEDSSTSEDARYLEGNVYTKSGMEISRKSAGNVKQSQAEINADSEEEDEFGYTKRKIGKKYRNFGERVMMVIVDRNSRYMGISLSGHKDRTKMAVFICGLDPNGSIYGNANLEVGDQILEVNGNVLERRSHLNASVIMRSIPGQQFKMIIYRRTNGNDDVAVKPVTNFPILLDVTEQYSQFNGVHSIAMKKGQYGLGIMIVEGKHADVGQGIFISDIQEGSVAEQAGLHVGDMILGVNADSLLEISYDQVTSILKRAEGIVTLIVCNPNENKKNVLQSETGSKTSHEVSGRVSSTSVSQNISPSSEMPNLIKEPPISSGDLKNTKNTSGKPMTIELSKNKDSAIGFVITGGSDTPSGGVFIHDIYPGGIADKDGRLKCGDQILEFAAVNFRLIEYEKARTAMMSANGMIKMVIRQDESAFEEFEVEINKKPGRGIGLSLTSLTSGTGVFITELLCGGSATDMKKLEIGDRIVNVSGQDVQKSSIDDVIMELKLASPILLRLLRYKSKT